MSVAQEVFVSRPETGISVFRLLMKLLLDIENFILFFLLGALCFKRKKVAYSTIIYVGLTFVLSVLAAYCVPGLMSKAVRLADSPESVSDFIQSVVVLDTVSGILLFVALVVGIYYRLRKIEL